MKPRCLQRRRRRSPLPTSVSFRPVLYRKFYFTLASRSRFICRRCRVYRFLRPHPAAYSRGVFPPIYTAATTFRLLFVFAGARVQHAYAPPRLFRPPFSPVTNGGALVSIELGSDSYYLSQVRRFPFVTTWPSARSGNALHNALADVYVNHDIVCGERSNSMNEINLAEIAFDRYDDIRLLLMYVYVQEATLETDIESISFPCRNNYSLEYKTFIKVSKNLATQK